MVGRDARRRRRRKHVTDRPPAHGVVLERDGRRLARANRRRRNGRRVAARAAEEVERRPPPRRLASPRHRGLGRRDSEARRRRRRASRAVGRTAAIGRSPRFFRAVRRWRAARRAGDRASASSPPTSTRSLSCSPRRSPSRTRGCSTGFSSSRKETICAARIIINKVDLADLDEARERFRAYENAGYPVHYTSVKTGAGLADLHACVHRPPVSAHGAVRRGKVFAAQRALSGLGPSRRRDQRIGEQGAAHDRRRADAAAARRSGLRHRHAGTSRGRPVGAAARAPRPVFSRDPRAELGMPLSPTAVTSPSPSARCARQWPRAPCPTPATTAICDCWKSSRPAERSARYQDPRSPATAITLLSRSAAWRQFT